jgi:spermidine synthase
VPSVPRPPARFFVLFCLSGAASLVYQVVWLRRAMADFGVTTPSVSIVLSVFMGGLALGSYGAGALLRRFDAGAGRTLVRAYALAEAWIGVSGLVVAPALDRGAAWLSAHGPALAWGSGAWYLASAAWIALVLLPFCTCMGATFPLALAAIRAGWPGAAERAFSYLYLANVLGAAAGLIGSAFVSIELWGFQRTLYAAIALNAVAAAAAWDVGRKLLRRAAASGHRAQSGATAPAMALSDRSALVLLFASGLVSLALEVVWTRMFIPFQGTVVYAFASTLAVYLVATAAGSWIYRRRLASRRTDADAQLFAILIFAALAALLPLAAADPRLGERQDLIRGFLRVLAGIGPFCAALGVLTPWLVERYARGIPRLAGRAYAWNGLGCVLGPLLAGFVLLPAVGERFSVALLAAPLAVIGIPLAYRAEAAREGHRPWRFVIQAALAGLAALALIALTRDWRSLYPRIEVLRDHTATVIAAEDRAGKHLVVNGVAMTSLTPITKMMVHLPLGLLEHPARRGLVLCFGMGTSFRSLRSWDVPATAVELVPSVPKLFGYYHADAEAILRSPDARIVVDDARRFLERTRESYDLIVVDPPPPIEAAGSSLLYSREFYEIAARRLAPGGILQQWLPECDKEVGSAVARALAATFPHVRAFTSVEGWGVHFLASMTPIPRRSGYEMTLRLPPRAATDLLEWGPAATAREQFDRVIAGELPLERLIAAAPDALPLTDDRPVNEYWLLRRAL